MISEPLWERAALGNKQFCACCKTGTQETEKMWPKRNIKQLIFVKALSNLTHRNIGMTWRKKKKKDCSSKRKFSVSICPSFPLVNFDITYAEIAQSSFRLILIFTKHCRKCFNRKKITSLSYSIYKFPYRLYSFLIGKRRILKVF